MPHRLIEIVWRVARHCGTLFLATLFCFVFISFPFFFIRIFNRLHSQTHPVLKSLACYFWEFFLGEGEKYTDIKIVTRKLRSLMIVVMLRRHFFSISIRYRNDIDEISRNLKKLKCILLLQQISLMWQRLHTMSNRFVVTHADGSRVSIAIISVCDSVCLSAR